MPISIDKAAERSTSEPARWIGLSGLFSSPSQRARRRLRAARNFFFIAYAREDYARIRPIVEAAEAEGYLFWIDNANLAAGGLWSADIVAAIRACRAVIVFCSRAAFASRDVYREIATASRFDKAILPVFVDDAAAPDEFLYYLSVHQAIRYGDADGPRRFLCALEALEKGKRRWKGSASCPAPLAV